MVVFNQGALCASCPSPDSIWAANLDTGAIVKLVDKSQPVPGSAARWDYFEARPVLKKNIVVFIAYDTAAKPGLYAVSVNGGAVTRLVDSTTAVPGASVSFDALDRGFSHDGTTVVFSGGGVGISGVYSVRIDGTGAARVADINTPVNSNQCDVFPVYLFGAPSISNGVIAIRGQTVFDSSNGFNGLYVGPLAKTVNPACTAFPSIVNSLERLPSDPATIPHTRYSYGILDGTTIYFRADNPDSNSGGIFSASATPVAGGNPITKVADTTTTLPVFGGVPFANSFTFAVSQRNVVFHASSPGRGTGLFLSSGGPVSKLIAVDDTLDGYRVRDVDAPTATSISGADVAFTWSRGDFQRQLSVARLASSVISIGGIANAASYASDAIAPGEVVAVFGTGLSPSNLQTAALDAEGRVSSVLSASRILFDGIPAPLVYVGAANGGQISAIVPYGIEGRQNVTVTAEFQGRLSAPFPVKVAAAAPGIYTADASGKGPGAIQNQDGSFNSAANPADRGSIIALYASGMGQTSPQGVDGQISGATGPRPVLPVSVSIGSVSVAPNDIVYQAMAPFAVTGLYQLNVRIPPSVPNGNQPVVLTVGGASSAADVTLAVR
jgi:uncharacterized protein (TIGR03437 family)